MDNIGEAALIVANLQVMKFWADVIMCPIFFGGVVFLLYVVYKDIH